MGPDHRRAQPAWVVAGLTSILLVVTVLGGSGSSPTAKAQEAQPAESPRPSYPDRPPREPVVLERTTLPDGSINTVVSLPAEADVYIASGVPNQNYETATLVLGYNPETFHAERILLRFDVLGELPDAAIINDATLQLFLYLANPASDPPMGTGARRLTSSWSEFSVTWANQPPASAEEYATTSVGSSTGWYYWQLTDLVAGWVNEAYPNHGLIIIGNESGQLHERFFISDEQAGEPGMVPQLIVDYTIDNQPPSVEVNPLPPVTNNDSFTVTWEDQSQGGAEIQYYDVQYRYNGGPWFLWLPQTLATSATFRKGTPVPDGLYEFEARGVDELGQVEPFQNRPEATIIVDAQPPFLVPRIWLPFVADS